MAFGLAVMLQSACSTLEVKGREALRLAPLREAAVAPAQFSERAMHLDASVDILSDDEVAAVSGTLNQELPKLFDEVLITTKLAPRRIGLLERADCTLDGRISRVATTYHAKCRVLLTLEGATVVDARGEAAVDARSRAISEEEAKAIKADARNPLFDANESRRAIRGALMAAFELIVHERVTPVKPVESSPQPQPSRETRAKLARQRLKDAVTPLQIRAGLFDLMSFGSPSDGAQVAQFVGHADPTVVQTAFDALAMLCGFHALGDDVEIPESHRKSKAACAALAVTGTDK